MVFRVWDLRAILPAPPPSGSHAASEASLTAITRVALGIDDIEAIREQVRGEEGGGLPLVAEEEEDAGDGGEEGLGYTGPDPCHRGRVTGEEGERKAGKEHRMGGGAISCKVWCCAPCHQQRHGVGRTSVCAWALARRR